MVLFVKVKKQGWITKKPGQALDFLLIIISAQKIEI